MHGGDLDTARTLFPDAPEPFIDLSTAINPHPYPVVEQGVEDFSHLPRPASLDRLAGEAAKYYGAPSKDNIVAGPGGQILMSLIAALIPNGRAAILGPTYAEHARVAALAGHEVATVTSPEGIGAACLAIVVNPNNPDGRLLEREDLVAVAERLNAGGGLLAVDEAFMDVGPREESLCSKVDKESLVVLRSFGKFFGLAGLRLSFAVAPRDLAARLRARLGPWPVSGPALGIGLRALNDPAWSARTRATLRQAAVRLATLLGDAGLEAVGGTDLFRLVRSADAPSIFTRLGRAGIYVRRFDDHPEWLRFGLPGSEDAWVRLERALRV